MVLCVPVTGVLVIRLSSKTHRREARIENPAHEEPGGICAQYNARLARWLPQQRRRYQSGGRRYWPAGSVSW